MFRRLPDAAVAVVAITVDGHPVSARAGDSVAAALRAGGLGTFGTGGVWGAARGPYCMRGVCLGCRVGIDGVGSRQACLVAVREGMRVETQRGRRPVEP